MEYYNDGTITVRPMLESDIEAFSAAFREQGWDKSTALLRRYYEGQREGRHAVLVAEYGGSLAGYLLVLPEAKLGPFAGCGISEIKDFNVLMKYRRRKIGTVLMDCAEALAKKTGDRVSLAVGLYPGYGPAQILYVRRGYIPDGSGVWHVDKNLEPYEPCLNDDDLNLYFIKRL